MINALLGPLADRVGDRIADAFQGTWDAIFGKGKH